MTRTDAQGFLLDVDAGFGDAVTARLRKFMLRTKVELETLPWRSLSLRGAGVYEVAAGLLTVLAEAGVLALPVDWPGWTGVDLLGPRDLVLDPAAGPLPAGVVACDRDTVEACPIVSGMPTAAQRADRHTSTAAEAGLVERTVEELAPKGCYTGPELVGPLDARGSKCPPTGRGSWRRGMIPDDAAARLSVGMTLHARRPAAGRRRRCGGRQGGGRHRDFERLSAELGAWVALGYLHRSIDVPGPLRVRSGDGLGAARPVSAQPLPLVAPAA